PAAAPKGQLRLVRSGGDLFFLANEDGDNIFKVLQKSDFGVKDLKNVRVLATTGTPGDALDVIISDFQIRADGFIKKATPPAPPPAAPHLSWLIPVGVGWGFFLLLAVSVFLEAWFRWRARRSFEPSRAA